MTGAWRRLGDEIERCLDAGITPTFWWRDDDAVAPVPALARMADLAGEFGIPLGLAVIPARAQDELAFYLEDQSLVDVMQHGYCHCNHAPMDQKSSEYPDGRAGNEISVELARGRQVMSRFNRNTNCFVPPWNRLGRQMHDLLADAGFAGVSEFGPAGQRYPLSALYQLNTHADIIAWRSSRGFVGLDHAIDALCTHLSLRRINKMHATEVTGLLTHHQVHDEACWDFLKSLFEFSGNYSTMRWLSVTAAMEQAIHRHPDQRHRNI